jgi:predicted PhzF superfamily epimerase YddE/YHI9
MNRIILKTPQRFNRVQNMQKDFDSWNEIKKATNYSESVPTILERETNTHHARIFCRKISGIPMIQGNCIIGVWF